MRLVFPEIWFELAAFAWRPRLWTWAAAETVLLAAAAWLLGRADLIPHHLPLNPAVVAVPLAAIFGGPAGVWGAAAGSLAADWAGGMWGPLTPWRAAGFALAALTAWRLWDVSLAPDAGGPALRPRWGQTMRFLAACVPAAVVAAALPALGAEWQSFYPYPYYFAICAIHHLVFMLLPGVALYRIAAREAVPRFGSWRGHPDGDAGGCRTSPRRALTILVTALGAPALALAVAAIRYRMGPFDPYVLGTRCGPGVTAAVLPLLGLHLLALLAPSIAPSGPARPDAGAQTPA